MGILASILLEHRVRGNTDNRSVHPSGSGSQITPEPERGSHPPLSDRDLESEQGILEGIRRNQARWEDDIEQDLLAEIRRGIESLPESDVEELLLLTNISDSEPEPEP